MAGRITTEQLLNLADRAEDGPLNAAEARRLREGIAMLSARNATLAGRLGALATHIERGALAELAAVRRLVASSEKRGASHIPLWAIAAASGAPVVTPHLPPKTEQAREGA
ncbi:hypothetical protein EAO70_06105 [Streptomyces sp. adm13(2018)]|uniref:hypothetical protein n=1 Tax=Streptomyces sp. adm13(2018) TaxID=2479007 RepID=UPI0011CE9523|nr:hypothetical protein [Streptomyces sp. adm13(2018)]TXS22430.1 hypothetical protein EAO70_06105 [Streptomyces sp. adm13(2018)]